MIILVKINYEDAYRFLLGLELYNLLNDEDSRMFIETNEYLCEACRIEIEEGIDAFYEYINKIYEFRLKQPYQKIIDRLFFYDYFKCT